MIKCEGHERKRSKDQKKIKQNLLGSLSCPASVTAL